MVLFALCLCIFFKKNAKKCIDKFFLICYNIVRHEETFSWYAAMAQLVEHILGKDEVPGPNPGSSSRQPRRFAFGALVLFRHFCALHSFCSFPKGLSGAVTLALRACSRRLPVRIPHSGIGELAHQAQSAGIFVFDEYL